MNSTIFLSEMNIYRIILLIFFLFYDSSIFLVAGSIFKYYTQIVCAYYECCNDDYVLQDVRALQDLLNTKVFGQKIALDTILQALHAHSNSDNTPKALAMSFHGTSGTGKTYVANMIGDTFYKYGHQSQYFHFINGRSDLTLESEVKRDQDMLEKKIVLALLNCPKSLFIFDEIDSMPEGVLDILVPFLDYNRPRVWSKYSNKPVETRKAIYIFITNAGSTKIMEELMKMWESGKSRNETKLTDFEDLTSTCTFNEAGGFHGSDAIKNSLIDHYVPFLPLEVEHIKLCIEAAFKAYGRSSPTIQLIDEVMSHLKFGPEPHNLYSESGCKRIESKVASIVYKRGLNIEL